MGQTAASGTRSYYPEEYSDEAVPCDCTLEGWASWLSRDDEYWPHEIPADGTVFTGSATMWKDDIVATCSNGEWTLSRDPEPGDFLAIRFGKGAGWDSDQICGDKESLLELLNNFGGDDGVEYIACGTHEDDWRFTYRAGPPPSFVAERAQ